MFIPPRRYFYRLSPKLGLLRTFVSHDYPHKKRRGSWASKLSLTKCHLAAEMAKPEKEEEEESYLTRFTFALQSTLLFIGCSSLARVSPRQILPFFSEIRPSKNVPSFDGPPFLRWNWELVNPLPFFSRKPRSRIGRDGYNRSTNWGYRSVGWRGDCSSSDKKTSSDRVKLVTQEVSVGISKGEIKPLVGTISGADLITPIGGSLGFLEDS